MRGCFWRQWEMVVYECMHALCAGDTVGRCLSARSLLADTRGGAEEM